MLELNPWDTEWIVLVNSAWVLSPHEREPGVSAIFSGKRDLLRVSSVLTLSPGACEIQVGMPLSILYLSFV